MNFKLLLSLFILTLFLSCTNKKDIIAMESKFIHTWESKKAIIPHMDNLTIKPDHTFEFYGGACMSNYNSAGKWKVVNDTLILNSIPSKECQGLSGFGNNLEDPTKKGFVRKFTFKNCQPDESNGEYINFINDKFYIKSDTLEYIANFKLPFNDRIAFYIKQ